MQKGIHIMKNNTRKIIIALVLVLTMLMSFATVSAFAEELLEGLDAFTNLPLVEQVHVDILRKALYGIAKYPVATDENITVKISKTEVAY